MKDKKMKDKEYETRFIKRIKEMFKIGIRTNSYSAVTWKYIERKSVEYNICKDLVEILEAELKAGLPDWS